MLARNIIQLNFDPFSYVHNSWIGSLRYFKIVNCLKDNARSAVFINEYVNDALGLSKAGYLEEITEVNRICLLSSAELYNLTYVSGLLTLYNECRKVIVKSEVSLLKKKIGIEQYKFLMDFGGELDYFNKFQSSIKDINSSTIFDRGVELIACCLRSQPDSLRLRLLLNYSIEKKPIFDREFNFNQSSIAIYAIDKLLALSEQGELPYLYLEE